MAGIAALAKAAGHRVTGSDRQVYPPMSTQLEALGIELTDGYGPEQLVPAPDCVVVGNVMTRGVPVVEALLESQIPYTSGPEWLARHVLAGRWVLAAAGTHGKTTTASLIAWILEDAGLDPGFLIGGIPANFGLSARLGSGPFFVVEADEYDTAFFDKRSKFVHYHPRTLVLGNLEFDHADIFDDLAAIQRQFHHLVRTVPGSGQIIARGDDAALAQVLDMGCWTPVTRFSSLADTAEWTVTTGDDCGFGLRHADGPAVDVSWPMPGTHNAENAAAALLAARHAGVPLAEGAAALSRFRGVRRRLELRGTEGGVRVYDDFAHHPTAVARTLGALRDAGAGRRILAVLEPRSNTMRMGVHRAQLAGAFAAADKVFVYAPADLGWDAAAALAACPRPLCTADSIDGLVSEIASAAEPGDSVLVMSNGGFGGIHERLLEALATGEAIP
jgi:UDP-N-acetylmuramate: L-alanyl-gamma-D-glutamyl-meso-diaminopimelate ligase